MEARKGKNKILTKEGRKIWSLDVLDLYVLDWDGTNLYQGVVRRLRGYSVRKELEVEHFAK